MLSELPRSSPRGTSTPALPLLGTAFCRSDRREALESLYRNEKDAIVAFLSGKVGPDIALDLTQEVFLRAGRSQHLTCLCNPAGFLRRIAINTMIDFFRSSRRRAPTMPICEETEASCPAEQDEELLAAELLRTVERVLRELPPRTADIFRMSRFERMTYREIHRCLGIALPTVDYHMMKALSKLRQELQSN